MILSIVGSFARLRKRHTFSIEPFSSKSYTNITSEAIQHHEILEELSDLFEEPGSFHVDTHSRKDNGKVILVVIKNRFSW
jgi:hypothetical protein